MKLLNFILPLLTLCAVNVSLSSLEPDDNYQPSHKSGHQQAMYTDAFPHIESQAIAYLDEWKDVNYDDQPPFIQSSIEILESSRRVNVSLSNKVATGILNFKKAQDALLLFG
jgi:nitrate reductase cytochrome c-type subunit